MSERIELIKWACENGYAEGWYYDEVEDSLSYNFMEGHSQCALLYAPQFDHIYWPLFLQRVIEGINSCHDDYEIEVLRLSIDIYKDNMLERVLAHGSDMPIDRAKYQALLWVKEYSS